MTAETAFYALSLDEQVSRLRLMASEGLKSWGLQAINIDLIKYRENAVFKISLPAQKKYALRIHRPGYHTDEELKAEIIWMQALAEYGLKVPELVPTLGKELFTVVNIDEIPEPRQVDLLQWIDAEPLGEIEAELGTDHETISRIYGTLGEIMARMHNQASSWHTNNKIIRHSWDMPGLVGEEPFWGQFWKLQALSPEQRQQMIVLRNKLKTDLANYDQSPENYGFIHADLVPENVLQEGNRLRIIDFDDAGHGWYLFDIATVLYFILDDPLYTTAFDALISAYRTQRELSDEQLSHLPLFLAARGTTYLGWVHTRKETNTARELTPMLIEMACKHADSYLERSE